MIRTPTPLERRVAAAQQLLDEWKDRPFSWADRNHCGRMVLEHVRRMGHKTNVSKAGTYKTALGAARALKRLGAENIGDLLDQHGFKRIAPAAALPGDVIELPSGDALGSLSVSMGNGRVLGLQDEMPDFVVLQPLQFGRAWRVQPR